MKTFLFSQVYVSSRASVVGPLESKGPLSSLFDATYDDLYCGESTFEKAETKMLHDLYLILNKKNKIELMNTTIAIGGDLLNQLSASHYFARKLNTSFVGMYAACATSSLIIGQGALFVENGINNVLCFTSSHIGAAERQFRYPNEYGVQKKESTTYTVTGAAACILSNKKSNVKVSAYTIGKIVDWNNTEVNDLGKAMAPAAFETILAHLKNRDLSFHDYDAIVSGDLSENGFSFLSDMLSEVGIKVDARFNDCGLMMYDKNEKKVFSGGSGCACSMCVSMTKLLDNVEKGIYKRLLVVATGALFSAMAVQQKESIPCIAHAIEYEWSDLK